MSAALGKYAELLGAQAPSEASPVTGCRHCGSRFFSVKQSSVYKCELNSSGSLQKIEQLDTETDNMSCWDCFKSDDELYVDEA